LDKQRIERPKQAIAITHLSFSHNGEFLLSKGIDRTIKVWNVATGECLATYTLLHEASAVAQFSLNDEFVLFEDMEYNIKIWNWKTNKIVGELTGHKAPITSLAVDSTGKYFLSSSKDHSIRLWDSQSLECTRIYYDELPRKVLFCSPNTFASAGQDTYIKLWRVD
jgi:WD40 repeat protein